MIMILLPWELLKHALTMVKVSPIHAQIDLEHMTLYTNLKSLLINNTFPEVILLSIFVNLKYTVFILLSN